MTLSELAKLPDVNISAVTAAEVIGMDPGKLRLAVTDGRDDIVGFPADKIGGRIRIPRIPFLRYYGWEGKINGADDYD